MSDVEIEGRLARRFGWFNLRTIGGLQRLRKILDDPTPKSVTQLLELHEVWTDLYRAWIKSVTPQGPHQDYLLQWLAFAEAVGGNPGLARNPSYPRALEDLNDGFDDFRTATRRLKTTIRPSRTKQAMKMVEAITGTPVKARRPPARRPATAESGPSIDTRNMPERPTPTRAAKGRPAGTTTSRPAEKKGRRTGAAKPAPGHAARTTGTGRQRTRQAAVPGGQAATDRPKPRPAPDPRKRYVVYRDAIDAMTKALGRVENYVRTASHVLQSADSIGFKPPSDPLPELRAGLEKGKNTGTVLADQLKALSTQSGEESTKTSKSIKGKLGELLSVLVGLASGVDASMEKENLLNADRWLMAADVKEWGAVEYSRAKNYLIRMDRVYEGAISAIDGVRKAPGVERSGVGIGTERIAAAREKNSEWIAWAEALETSARAAAQQDRNPQPPASAVSSGTADDVELMAALQGIAESASEYNNAMRYGASSLGGADDGPLQRAITTHVAAIDRLTAGLRKSLAAGDVKKIAHEAVSLAAEIDRGSLMCINEDWVFLPDGNPFMSLYSAMMERSPSSTEEISTFFVSLELAYQAVVKTCGLAYTVYGLREDLVAEEEYPASVANGALPLVREVCASALDAG